MKKRMIILLIIIAVAFSGYFLMKKYKNKEDADALKLSGNVEVTENNPGFKIPGKITELLTDEGYAVKKGQKIASLDGAELRDLLTQTAQQHNEACARLHDLEAGSRPQEISQAKAGADSAEADLIKAKKDYERAKTLFDNGAISAADFDSAKRIYDVSLLAKKSALEKLSLVKEGFRKEEIVAARHIMNQTLAAQTAAKTRLGDTVLYAPADGVVLKKNFELGDIVSAGAPVFTIGDLKGPYIKVYAPETKVGRVKLNQKAEVSVDSYPGKIYEGVVSYISSEAEFTPKNIQTQEERVKLVYEVKVNIKNENDELKPGMPADVKIILK